jgi:acyl-CoA synthetase (AMP-forming)/AMP-acid ligase II/pyrroloquinoline quinone (PQQ) biosynthesis protein C
MSTIHTDEAPAAHLLSPLWADVISAGLLAELHANPFLAACRRGSVTTDQLQEFLIQHRYYSQYFTRYLCSLMGNMGEHDEFKALAENLAEELASGSAEEVSHAEMYLQAMHAMSASPGSRPILASTQQLIDTMFRYCRGSDPLDGLAALCLGAEAIVPVVYGPILDALHQRNAPPEATRFFQLHVEEDEQHAIVMREVIDRMLREKPYRRARVAAVGEELVRLRMAMLSDLLFAAAGADGAGQARPPETALLPDAALARLRADTSLGSANFLDRCMAQSVGKHIDFLFLDKPVPTANDEPIRAFSLASLHRYRKTLAHWYLGQNVHRGEIVAVCVTDGIAPFLHYLALTSLGCAIALINPAMPAEAGAVYMRENRFDRLVTDADTLASSAFAQEWKRFKGEPGVLDSSSPQLSADPVMPEWWPAAPEDSTLVMLSHTSGTTGVPKAVRFEHRQFFMGKRARIGRFAEGPDERLLSALPQSHSAAISHLETAVLHGIPTYVMSTQAGPAVRDAIRAFEPTTVVAFPKTYVQLVETGVAEGEFACVRRWFSMGDAAHQSHTRQVLKGAPRSRFIDAFGSSELGMALFRSESTIDAIAPRRSIGRPVEVAVAKILNPATGEEVAPGEIGLLGVRAPTITSGYWLSPERTAGSWRGGYFLTGDVAFCKDGNYFQIDREVDIVKTTSGSAYTLLLEEAAQQVDGVCDVTVVGIGGGEGKPLLLCAFVLPERHTHQTPESIARRVRAALHHELDAQGAVLTDDALAVAVVRDLSFLPVGATGKVLKRLVRRTAASMLEQSRHDGGASADLLHLAWPGGEPAKALTDLNQSA